MIHTIRDHYLNNLQQAYEFWGYKRLYNKVQKVKDTKEFNEFITELYKTSAKVKDLELFFK